MNLKSNPAFLDTRNMKVGDLIIYDKSKEGTGERARGIIKEISRSSLALVLEDGTPIGVTRVYAHWHTPPATHAKPWFIRSDEDDASKKNIISTPF